MFLIKLTNLALMRSAWARFLTCMGLLAMLANTAVSAENNTAEEQLFTVLNPTGIAPAIDLKSMAARPDSLNGKTVYLVDVTFNSGDLFLLEMQKWMAVNLPEVKTEFRRKRGLYASDDADLWKEIQAVNGLMIMAIGH